jgi:hypothetical protein
MLSDNSGKQNILLDSGYVGTIGSEIPGKKLNNDPNYLAWNKGLLKYDGQTLDVVFRDLERVNDMKIVADDPEILDLPWATTIDNQPHDTINRQFVLALYLLFNTVSLSSYKKITVSKNAVIHGSMIKRFQHCFIFFYDQCPILNGQETILDSLLTFLKSGENKQCPGYNYRTTGYNFTYDS